MLWDSVSIKYRIEIMENFDGFESLEGLENFKGFDNPAYEFEESINQPFEVKSGKKGSHKNFVGNEYGQNGASTETPENARPVDVYGMSPHQMRRKLLKSFILLVMNGISPHRMRRKLLKSFILLVMNGISPHRMRMKLLKSFMPLVMNGISPHRMKCLSVLLLKAGKVVEPFSLFCD